MTAPVLGARFVFVAALVFVFLAEVLAAAVFFARFFGRGARMVPRHVAAPQKQG